MKKFLLGGIVILFGFLIVVISVVTTRANLTDPAVLEATGKEFYLDRKIYPDHVFYPVLALFDQLQVKMVTQAQQRSVLRVGFSRERLLAAEVLLERGRVELAMTTLDKAHSYWVLAASEALEIDSDYDKLVLDYLRRYSLFMDQELQLIAPKVTDAQRARLDVIREEQKILREQLP